ncbi:MAG: hypothetical protein R3B06_28265 [Kofleriaceae bacterium]
MRRARQIVAATVAVALGAILVGSTSPASAKCARVLLVPQVLTHPADAIPAGGGVLVGYSDSTDGGAERYADGDPAAHTDWSMVVGKRRIRPRLEVLAPGLAVYRPTATRTARPQPLRLREADGREVGAFTTTRATRAFAVEAPQLGSVTAVITPSGRRYGGTTTTVTATVANVPADAVAIIAYRAGKGTPLPVSWSRVAAGATSVALYESPGRCASDPVGRVAPAAGDTIVVAWVDAFGRRSPMSQPIVVK